VCVRVYVGGGGGRAVRRVFTCLHERGLYKTTTAGGARNVVRRSVNKIVATAGKRPATAIVFR